MNNNDLIKKNREEILLIAKKYGVISIKLFGSSIRNEDTPSSDIDLFVDFEDTRSLFDLIGFKNELEELLGKSVDVVTVKGVHPLMKEQIETEAVKI